MRHAWAAAAIVCGAWETLAVLSRRAPTITAASHQLCAARPAARPLVVLAAAGLARHLPGPNPRRKP